MPIIVPNGLPAISELAKQNITVMTQSRATTQDIRPIKIVILNLMPKKIETENQLISVISNNSLQIELTLIQTASYQAKNCEPHHLQNFYKTFNEIEHDYFDGMIITGAPVETIPFEEVEYWEELCNILEWSKKHIFSTLHICWGAQAALYYHYGIPKKTLKKKQFGVFNHRVHDPFHPLLRGFDDFFEVPHSRYTDILSSDINKIPELQILSTSPEAGIYLIAHQSLRQVYVTGHPEYETSTLDQEYKRDCQRQLGTQSPQNYYDQGIPKNKWRGHAHLFFNNWINYIYQEVPYELPQIKELKAV